MHHAIRGPVYAMGRPRRPGSERVAVRAAAARLPDALSASRKASEIARQAIAAFVDDEGREPFERALAGLSQTLDPDPVQAIANDGIVAEKFVAERMARFEARGCRQVGDEAWRAETRSIARTVQAQLARRFRDYLT